MGDIIQFPSKPPELAVVPQADPVFLTDAQRRVQLKRIQESLKRIHKLLEDITDALSQRH